MRQLSARGAMVMKVVPEKVVVISGGELSIQGVHKKYLIERSSIDSYIKKKMDRKTG